MAILDSSLTFSSNQAISGSGDVVSNYMDQAPWLTANAPCIQDFAIGEESHIIAQITAAVTGASVVGMQPILQADNNSNFDGQEKPQEFPISMPLLSATFSSASITGSVMTVTTLTAGTVQVGALVSGGSVPAGLYVTGQLTGAVGAGAGATYQLSNALGTGLNPTGCNSAYTGRTVGNRMPTYNLKRYLRVVWRNSVATSTAGTGTAYITKDPQNTPAAPMTAPSYFVG